MSQETRQKKRHSLVGILLLSAMVLIVALAFFYFKYFKVESSKPDDTSLYIAKVNGVGLSREAFESEVSIAEQNSLSLGADTALRTKIRKDVLTSHVISYLLVELANSLNVKISDNRLNKMIQQQKVFYENGSFNQKKYLELLEANGYSPELYAETLRANAEKEQLINALIISEFVLPVDSELSLLQNQIRTGYYGTISPNIVDYDTIDVSEEDILSFYNEHQDSFIRPNRVKVKYIINSYSKAVDDVLPVTPEDIQHEYSHNKKKYSSIQKEQYELIKVNTKAEANLLYKQLKRNKLDKQILINNDQLIPLGWFSADSLPDLLKKQKLSKKRFVSKPFWSDDSYIIVVLTNTQKPQLLPLQSVSNKIKYILWEERALALYHKRNQQLKKAINNKKITLEDLANQTDNEVIIPEDWQTPIEYNSILLNSKIKDVAFSELMVSNNVATNNISDLIEGDNPIGTYVIQVTDYRTKGLAPLEEVKKKIIDDIKRRKAIALFKDEAQSIVDKLNKNEPVDFMLSTKYLADRSSTDLKQSTVDMIFSLNQPINSKNRIHGIDFLSQESAIIAVLTDVKNSTEVKNISTQLLPIMTKNENQALSNALINKANIEFMISSN